MKTPSIAAMVLLGAVVANTAFAQAVAEEPISKAQMDPFGMALLGAGLTGIALSQILSRRR